MILQRWHGSSADMPKGHWRPLGYGPSGEIPTASAACPDCGRVATLDQHAISSEGQVSPSVRCACGFHETIKLAGWKTRTPGAF